MREERGFSLIELLIVVAVIGIIAGIAIPGLLRARISANEAAAIGDTRSILSADATFASANAGCYATTLALLYTPPADHGNVRYIDAQMATTPGVKQGYLHGYTTIAAAAPPCCTRIPIGGGAAAPCGDPGVAGYLYASNPATFNSSGIHSYLADHSGMICQCNTGGCAIPVGPSGLAACSPI